MTLADKLRWLEVKHDGEYEFSWLINHDVAPMPPHRRELGFWGFQALWAIPSVTIQAFSAGASLLGLGLNVAYSMGGVTIGNTILALYNCLNSEIGMRYHVGYSVSMRMVFGVYGSAIGIIIRIVLSVILYASNTWVGGLGFVVMFSAWSKDYMNWEKEFVSGILMRDFIGFLICWLVQMPFNLMRPEKLTTFINITCFITLIGMLGVFGHSVHANGGPGPIYNQKETLQQPSLGWMFLQAASVWYGGLAQNVANVSDYTRFAKPNRLMAYVGIVVGVMLAGTLVPILGLVTASACQELYGVAYWLPTDICLQWLSDTYTPAVRCAAWFCGFAFASSQMAFVISFSGIAFGMDVSAFFAKYIDIKRGSVICGLLCWAALPWEYYTSSSTFLTVLSAFGAIVTPIVSLMVTDFLIVRRCKIHIEDLYTASPQGRYYFTYGVNFRAVIVWAMAVAPGLPGIKTSVDVGDTSIPTGLNNYFYGDFLFAFFCPMILYTAICYVFPLPHLYETDEEDVFNAFTLEECKRLGMAPKGDGFVSEIIEGEMSEQKSSELEPEKV